MMPMEETGHQIVLEGFVGTLSVDQNLSSVPIASQSLESLTSAFETLEEVVSG